MGMISNLNFENPTRQLFAEDAEAFAKFLVKEKGKTEISKSTLRKIYDELVMWNDVVQHSDNANESFSSCDPYIQMMRSKVAYMCDRNLITISQKNELTALIRKVDSSVSLKHVKLFFESVIGYVLFELKGR